MVKAQLIEKVKRNKFFYRAYYYTMSVIVNFLKLFVKTDDRLILFVSYGGRFFNDSPKCIYEAMKVDKRFKDYKLVWAFRNPKKFDVENKIKIDTFKFYKTALKARCWVTNVNMERGLNFTGKKTYYFHTTHGALPKLSGTDVRNGQSFGWDFHYKYDCSCAQSYIEKQYQLSMFGLKDEQVLVCGYPKNDALLKVTTDDKNKVLAKLGLPQDKIVILYAPTFREDNVNEMNSPIDFKKWEKILGNDFILLYRAHPTVSNKTKIDSSTGFIFDVSTYHDNTELMIASDILISDYSGIFFEFAVLRRPMFCYAYDYEEYEKTRGLYFDIRKELPSGDENQLLEMIRASDYSKEMELVEDFINKYVTEYGRATELAVNNIYKNI